jgi:hypothetical protein
MRRARRLARLAAGLAVAAALHLPLFRPARPAAGAPGKKLDIRTAVELERDMKEVGKALAAIEQKAAEQAEAEAPGKPPAAHAAPAAPAGGRDGARDGDDAVNREAAAGAPRPLTTPKMLASKLPPRPDAAPPPPRGSGDPNAPDARRVTYREAEKGSGPARGGSRADEADTPVRPPAPASPPVPPPAALAAAAASGEAPTPGDLALAASAPARAPAPAHGGSAGRRGSPGEAEEDGGVEVPTIHFRPWESRDQLIAVAGYFGMQLIAYPETRDFFVIVQLATNRFEVSREFGWLKLFSNRMIAQDGPLFDELRRKIGAATGAPAGQLAMGLLMPIKSANYLAWKEIAVMKQMGLDPAAVESVSARFVRNDEGKWNLFVDELHLKSGQRVSCGEKENRVAN